MKIIIDIFLFLSYNINNICFYGGKIMQKLLDFIYVILFGKNTLDGFVNKKIEEKKCNYIFDSVFPNEEIFKIALPPIESSIISK